MWADCPIQEIFEDPSMGYYDFDDFRDFDGTVSTNVGRYISSTGGYRSYEDTGASIAMVATEETGVIRLNTGAVTDNLEACIGAGSGNAGKAKIVASATPPSTGKKLWFETRIRANQVSGQNIFVGLVEAGRIVTDGLFSDADVGQSHSKVGFRILAGDADGMDAFYHKNGGSEVVVKEEAKVIAAGSWYRFGFKFDPRDSTLRYYVDGVEAASVVIGSTANPISTFPDSVSMNWALNIKNSGGAVQSTLDCDWRAFAQLR
jgi:hypothetical protein